MGLPDEIEIPYYLQDDEDIANWLSDEYGFCHEGFELKKIFPHRLPKKILCPCCGKELIDLSPTNNPWYTWCEDCNLQIEFYPDDETPVSISNNIVRADWYNAGEGLRGDYNPEDPDDINLLRFDIYINTAEHTAQNAKWSEVDDASYCTRTSANSTLENLTRLLYAIFKEYNNVLSSDPDTSVKNLPGR